MRIKLSTSRIWEVATKVCTKCGQEKGFAEFGKEKKGKFGVRASCKCCDKERTKQWYQSNKDKKNEYLKQWRETNKEQLKEYDKQWREANKEQLKEYNKQWREANKEQRKEYDKQWREANKEQRKEYDKQYQSTRRQTDDLFRLTKNIRSLIRYSIRNEGFKKSSMTAQILGCSFEEFYTHLESQFESWMNWDNYGKYNGELNFGWDIDHIIPSSIGQTPDEMIELSHYTNLQPLCSKINRDIKRNNII